MTGKKINSREKGKRAEREFANRLKELGYEAARGVQYSGGRDSSDIRVMDPRLEFVHFEVKFYATNQLHSAAKMREWTEQATRDAGTGALPVIAHRWNGSKTWYLVLLLPNRAPVITTLEGFLQDLELWRNAYAVALAGEVGVEVRPALREPAKETGARVDREPSRE